MPADAYIRKGFGHPQDYSNPSTRDGNINYDFFSEYQKALDFSLTVKAAPHECVIRTSQP